MSCDLEGKAVRPGKSGGRSRARTYDPLIKSQLLYQLSYAPEPSPFNDLDGTTTNLRLALGSRGLWTGLDGWRAVALPSGIRL